METHVLLDGPGTEATLTGAYVTGHGHHLDQQVVVEHRTGRTVSRQKFHGIGCGKGRSVFNGRIHIHPHATGSDAHLVNRNLALHREAEMNTKPELEIYADDVRCAHGATVGQPAADAVFYLESRGVPAAVAQTMLAHAFLRECLTGVLGTEITPRFLEALGR
jgi:Fe-S cluster assembly protein SufD